MSVLFARKRVSGGRRRSAALLAPLAVVGVLAVTSAIVLSSAPQAQAAQAPVGLGTATSFAVLAGTTVTNTGPTTISGDLGVSPGSAVTGFPPGTVNNGVIHAADAVALQAQNATTTAYNDAAGRTPSTAVSGDLTGQTLVAGVYKSTSSLGLTGTVTLDAQGDPNAVFVFDAVSTLITGSASNVALINGAQACNVFWQVGSSATLGTNSNISGTLLALTSISATTGAVVNGRLLARNGAVTLDDNTITRSDCSAATGTPTGTATATGPGTPTGTATGTATGTPTGGETATATSTATSTGGGGNGGGGNGGGGNGGGGHLATTGADLVLPAVAGIGLIVFGIAAVAAGRRKRFH